MTLTEYKSKGTQPARLEDIGTVILEKDEYLVKGWDENGISEIVIFSEDGHLIEGRDSFFIKVGNPLVYLDTILSPEILESVFAVKLEDVC